MDIASIEKQSLPAGAATMTHTSLVYDCLCVLWSASNTVIAALKMLPRNTSATSAALLDAVCCMFRQCKIRTRFEGQVVQHTKRQTSHCQNAARIMSKGRYRSVIRQMS